MTRSEHNSIDVTFFALIAFSMHLDTKLCPLAPSPIMWEETASLRLDPKNGKFDVPNSVQSASRLIDTRKPKAPTIGWLYLDEHGSEYVALIPPVSSELYAAFDMKHNWHRPDTYTEAVPQPTFRLPSGIEIRSCTQPDH